MAYHGPYISRVSLQCTSNSDNTKYGAISDGSRRQRCVGSATFLWSDIV